MFTFLPLSIVERFYPLIASRGLGVAAKRAFLSAYREADGSEDALPHAVKELRTAALRQHVDAMRETNESYWIGGLPTDRHLAMIAWGYSPQMSDLVRTDHHMIESAVENRAAVLQQLRQRYGSRQNPMLSTERGVQSLHLRNAGPYGANVSTARANLYECLCDLHAREIDCDCACADPDDADTVVLTIPTHSEQAQRLLWGEALSAERVRSLRNQQLSVTVENDGLDVIVSADAGIGQFLHWAQAKGLPTDRGVFPYKGGSALRVESSVFTKVYEAISENKWVSAGCVVIEQLSEQTSVWIVAPRHVYGGKAWTLPKGRVDSGETIDQTARREVFEETGLSVRILPDSLMGVYSGTHSMTQYFVALRTGGSPRVNEEVEKIKRVPLKDAQQVFEKAGNDRDARVCAAAYEWLRRRMAAPRVTVAEADRAQPDAAKAWGSTPLTEDELVAAQYARMFAQMMDRKLKGSGVMAYQLGPDPNVVEVLAIRSRRDYGADVSFLYEEGAVRIVVEASFAGDVMYAYGPHPLKVIQDVQDGWAGLRRLGGQNHFDRHGFTVETAALSPRKLQQAVKALAQVLVGMSKAYVASVEAEANTPGSADPRNPYESVAPRVTPIDIDESEAQQMPAFMKRCVVKVKDKDGGPLGKAFAICTDQMQKSGYLKKGEDQEDPSSWTAKGKKANKKAKDKDDWSSVLAKYKKLVGED